MGEPIRILDVVRTIISRYRKDIPIVFTGLREGEKLHEDLFGVAEHDERPLHPLISRVAVEPLAPDALGAELAGWPVTDRSYT